MKIIEIIHVRLLAREPKILSERIRESIDYEITDKVFTIFQRDNLESDLAVHIHRNEYNRQSGPGQFGIHLASSLKAYGLVDHTVWKELI